jgi:hypothetical protein
MSPSMPVREPAAPTIRWMTATAIGSPPCSAGTDGLAAASGRPVPAYTLTLGTESVFNQLP